MPSLERELSTYQRELPVLRAQTGKHVLVRQDDVVGVFDTYNDALKAGYERFKLEPFLVKKIEAVEQILHFTRAIEPICP